MDSPAFDPTTGPRPRRLLIALAVSAAVHGVLVLELAFDVLGIGGGFGLGSGRGLGAGGGAGLGEPRKREIDALQDLPAPVPPRDPTADEKLRELLKPARPEAVALPRTEAPRLGTPVVQFARPARPLGSGVDLGSRFASAGAGAGGLGTGGGGGAGWSPGSA